MACRLKKIIWKLLVFILILAGISFLSFSLIYLAPGDYAEIVLEANGIKPTPEALQNVREELGLNRPFLVQYGTWFIGILHGDFGISYKTGASVADELIKAMPNTLQVAVGALVLTLLIAIPLGIVCAVKKNSFLDRLIRMITFIFAAFPNFFLSLLVMYFLGMRFSILPVIGTTGKYGYVMPILVLALGSSAGFTRQIRTIVLEELNKEYVQCMEIKGISKWRILFLHVLKNAGIPLLTMAGMRFGSMLGGTVIVENIFTWPGIGKIAVEAISQRNYPLVQGFVVWMSVVYFGVNALLEVLYRQLDPRLRRSK